MFHENSLRILIKTLKQNSKAPLEAFISVFNDDKSTIATHNKFFLKIKSLNCILFISWNSSAFYEISWYNIKVNKSFIAHMLSWEKQARWNYRALQYVRILRYELFQLGTKKELDNPPIVQCWVKFCCEVWGMWNKNEKSDITDRNAKMAIKIYVKVPPVFPKYYKHSNILFIWEKNSLEKLLKTAVSESLRGPIETILSCILKFRHSCC